MTLARVLWAGLCVGVALALALSAFVALCMWGTGCPFKDAAQYSGQLFALLAPTAGGTLATLMGLRLCDQMVRPPQRHREPVRLSDGDAVTAALAMATAPPVLTTDHVEQVFIRARACAMLQISVQYEQERSPTRKYVTENWAYSQQEWNAGRGILSAAEVVDGQTWADISYGAAARQLGKVRLDVESPERGRLWVPGLTSGHYQFLTIVATPENNNYLLAAPPHPEEEDRYEAQ